MMARGAVGAVLRSLNTFRIMVKFYRRAENRTNKVSARFVLAVNEVICTAIFVE